MLKFSTYKTTGGLNHYAENKDFELEFIILLNPTGDYELREYQYGVLEEYKYFNKLAEAKAWANKNNDYLAEVDAIETESEDLDFLDSLCDDGLMP
jgi:hypothetical protein